MSNTTNNGCGFFGPVLFVARYLVDGEPTFREFSVDLALPRAADSRDIEAALEVVARRAEGSEIESFIDLGREQFDRVIGWSHFPNMCGKCSQCVHGRAQRCDATRRERFFYLPPKARPTDYTTPHKWTTFRN